MGELFAGRYELVDPLGRGAAGSVWRAWDHKRQEYTAAKLLRHVDAMSMLRFVREHSYRLDHPHVVVPVGWAGEGERVLFTMPLVRGGSAENLLDAYGMVPPEWVAVLLDQLLDALGAVHAMGIVHRDLKPSNLLLEPTGADRPHLRLSDVGIAAQLGLPRLTRVGDFVGTPGYLAPEQPHGAPPDPRQDLFACGAVAAVLLRGRSPVHEDGVPSPLEPDAPLGIPAPLWGVLRWLAAPSPDDRPLDAGEARTELVESGCVPDREVWAHAVEAAPQDGSGVVVPDQLVRYPEQWGPDGPLEPGPPGGPLAGGAPLFLRRPADVAEELSEEPAAGLEPEPAQATEPTQEPEQLPALDRETGVAEASEPEPVEPDVQAAPEPPEPPERVAGSRGRRHGVAGLDEVVEAVTMTGEVPVVRPEREDSPPRSPSPREQAAREQVAREQEGREQGGRERSRRQPARGRPAPRPAGQEPGAGEPPGPGRGDQRPAGQRGPALQQPPGRPGQGPESGPARYPTAHKRVPRGQAGPEQTAPHRARQPGQSQSGQSQPSRSQPGQPQPSQSRRSPDRAAPDRAAPDRAARAQEVRSVQGKPAPGGPRRGPNGRNGRNTPQERPDRHGAPPVWATAGEPLPAPVRRRRSGRILRAVAVVATVLGLGLLLAAGALLFLR